MQRKIWFITGISSGLGKALAKAVMNSGDFVIGTFRKQSQVDEFNRLHKENTIGLTLDITRPNEIENAFEIVRERYGKIDVLVNNAGFGLAGAIEETSTEETREIFEVNFFGTLKLTQTFLSMFRRQKGGHIIQISSHGGVKSFAGFGIYNASKFALEGFSEALAQEIAPLGIKLTIVEPGPFRTNFASNSFRQAKAIIDDYNETASAFRQKIKLIDGKQEGDPAKAAQVIVDIAQLDTPPLRLPLGKIAFASLTDKLNNVKNDLEKYKDIAEKVVY